jgi:hypothetical protein
VTFFLTEQIKFLAVVLETCGFEGECRKSDLSIRESGQISFGTSSGQRGAL